jgi:hypothetical protein
MVTTEGFFAAQFFSAAGVVGSSGGYEIKQWKTYLIFVAILTFGTLVISLATVYLVDGMMAPVSSFLVSDAIAQY